MAAAYVFEPGATQAVPRVSPVGSASTRKLWHRSPGHLNSPRHASETAYE